MRGQTALEYLIIIALIAIISGLVIVLVSGSLGGKKENVLYNACASAAAQCRGILTLNHSADCSFCEDACKDPLTNQEIFRNATWCCKLGRDDQIYVGTEVNESCNAYCGDGVCDWPLGENETNCPQDCQPAQLPGGFCGAGECAYADAYGNLVCDPIPNASGKLVSATYDGSEYHFTYKFTGNDIDPSGNPTPLNKLTCTWQLYIGDQLNDTAQAACNEQVILNYSGDLNEGDTIKAHLKVSDGHCESETDITTTFTRENTPSVSIGFSDFKNEEAFYWSRWYVDDIVEDEEVDETSKIVVYGDIIDFWGKATDLDTLDSEKIQTLSISVYDYLLGQNVEDADLWPSTLYTQFPLPQGPIYFNGTGSWSLIEASSEITINGYIYFYRVGKYRVSICAKDGSGRQGCANITILVRPAINWPSYYVSSIDLPYDAPFEVLLSKKDYKETHFAILEEGNPLFENATQQYVLTPAHLKGLSECPGLSCSFELSVIMYNGSYSSSVGQGSVVIFDAIKHVHIKPHMLFPSFSAGVPSNLYGVLELGYAKKKNGECPDPDNVQTDEYILEFNLDGSQMKKFEEPWFHGLITGRRVGGVYSDGYELLPNTGWNKVVDSRRFYELGYYDRGWANIPVNDIFLSGNYLTLQPNDSYYFGDPVDGNGIWAYWYFRSGAKKTLLYFHTKTDDADFMPCMTSDPAVDLYDNCDNVKFAYAYPLNPKYGTFFVVSQEYYPNNNYSKIRVITYNVSEDQDGNIQINYLSHATLSTSGLVDYFDYVYVSYNPYLRRLLLVGYKWNCGTGGCGLDIYPAEVSLTPNGDVSVIHGFEYSTIGSDFKYCDPSSHTIVAPLIVGWLDDPTHFQLRILLTTEKNNNYKIKIGRRSGTFKDNGITWDDDWSYYYYDVTIFADEISGDISDYCLYTDCVRYYPLFLPQTTS